MKLHLILSAAALGLVGCSTPPASLTGKTGLLYRQADTTAAVLPSEPMKVDASTAGSAAAVEAMRSRARPVAKHATRAWHGSRMSDVQNDAVLPPIFSETFQLNFDDRSTQGRVAIAVVAERLSRITGVPVRIKTDVYSTSAIDQQAAAPALATTKPVATAVPLSPVPLPSGVPAGAPAGEPVAVAPAPKAPETPFVQPLTSLSSVEMAWNGTLSSYLDHVTGQLNLSWSYRGGAVIIERYLTESFELMAFGGTQDYKMALTGGSSGSGGTNGATGSSSTTLDLTESGKMAALDSLRRAVESVVVPAGGSVVLNEGTGRFFVTATKDVMGRVRDLIKIEDASLQRQAHIQFDVYSVIKDDSDQAGVDWSVLYRNLSSAWGATIKSPTTLTGASAGLTGINILTAKADGTAALFGGSSAVLNLLNQVGTSAMYRPVSMVAMNRQWARKTNLKVDGYVSETTPSTASSAGSGAPGLKTDSITTGDKFMVQPAILDSGAILLKFGVSLTELLGLLDVTAGAGETLQKVQTPVTSGTDDQGTVRLMPGEAMVVTGLSRRLASSDRRALTSETPIGLGGSRKETHKREDFVIVVRATQI